MTFVVSKAGIHCIGPRRNGYTDFLRTIHESDRRLALVKVRDDLGAVDEPLIIWPDVLCIGTFTDWDGFPFDWQAFEARAKLKPEIKIWEVLNEINGEWTAQADLYIDHASRFAANGWSLCMFNCASGTPPYPDEDGGHAYREIARACRFMRDNGYSAYLGLHEYYTPSDTIGRYKRLADYLESQNALLPIVITEWGYETNPGDAIYMQFVRDTDPLYMADPRVLGTATWTLGGAGWQGSNYETMLPQLGEYIANVGSNQTVPLVFGVHSTASPGQMADGDAQGITAAEKFNGYKFLTGDPVEHYAQVAALGIVPANCLTRLFVSFADRPKPSAEQFCDEQRLAIQEAMAAFVTWFEVHNEPNIPAEWPYSTDPHDFISWLLQVYAQLRVNHPGIKLVSPGLSPQPNTPQWWTAFAEHGVFEQSDAIGAHVYWRARSTMLTQQDGLNFIPLEQYASAAKPIYITEYSNNQTADTDFDKGAQYVEWAAYIQQHHPLVARTYLYIISSGTLADNISRQTIVRGGVVSQIARGIADTAPAPVTSWRFEHYHLDGGAAITDNPITIVMDKAHTLIVNAVEVSSGRFLLSVTIDPPQARVEIILTPPQPPDGYAVGTAVNVFTRALPD